MPEVRLELLFSFTLMLTCIGHSSADIKSLLDTYCPGSTECQTSTGDTKETPNNHCLACSCGLYCAQKGNCCPNQQQFTNKTRPRKVGSSPAKSLGYDDNQQFACIVPRSNIEQTRKQVSLATDHLGLYMVASCPRDIADENCTKPDKDILEENLPQTSTNTGITYRNIYCGICNNETEMVPWKPYITCSDSVLLKAHVNLFPISLDKMYKLAVSSDQKDCGVEFRHPNDFDEARDLCYAKELVRTCALPDELLNDACRSFSMPYFHEQNNITTAYANVFCFLCQNDTTSSDNQFNELLTFPRTDNALVGELNIDHVDKQSIGELSLRASEMVKIYNPNCDPGFIYDPYKEECREWYCPMDTAALDSACIPILKTVETGTYQLRLTVEPEEENKELFQSVNSTNLTSSLLTAMFENEGSSKSEIVMIAGNQTEPRIFVIAVIRIHSAANRTSLFGKGHFNRTYKVSVGLKETLSIKVRLTTGVWVEIMTFPVWSVHMLDTNRNLYLPVIYVGDDVVNVYEYPTVDKLAFCLHVILDRHEYIDFISHVRIMISGLELYIGEFIRMQDSRKLRVCYDDYVKFAPEQLSQKQKATDYMEPQVIASVACTSMSISCLVITIFTYVIFSELRSIPGKNNILLAVHLLIAQCLYQFTFTRTEHPRLCIAFGIFTHFFWLTAILWMSACTLHMFRVFVTKNRVSSKHALDPQVCMYAMYCYVIASVAVAINIGVSLKRSNGKSIGYGGRICYISEPSMVGFTFALPVGIIVCLNIMFFIIVIYKISESTMRLRGGQSNDRYNAVIYMKLSSLTGAAWIFGYLYIWTGFLPLEYIFIVLNAGQGVFIFVSFICNSKILRLYHELFRKYGRRLFRTICKENSKLPSRRQKPAEKKIVKTVVTSNKSEESNKSDTSSNSVPKTFLISSNPMPPCPTDASPNNIVLAVNESKMGGGVTADTLPNSDAFVGHM